MSRILHKIITLEPLARNMFLAEIFESNNKVNRVSFLLILKYADEEIKEEFYQRIGEDGRYFFQEEIERLEATDKEELHAAEQVMSRMLENLEQKITLGEKDAVNFSKQVKEYRNIMKSGFVHFSHVITDQRRGIEIPSTQKVYDTNAEITDLPFPDESILKKPNIFKCIKERKSRRKYTEESLTLADLSYLLWATQGIREVSKNRKGSLRNVPSGGAKHPFETYLTIRRVESLKQGVYRYLPFDHKLVYLFAVDEMAERLTEATFRQSFIGESAVIFIWSVIPYRCEWRYAIEAKKIILQDSGHLCQNLYLACESISCGTVAIGAYHQELMDEFLQLDGEDEFVVYLAPVGKISPEEK